LDIHSLVKSFDHVYIDTLAEDSKLARRLREIFLPRQISTVDGAVPFSTRGPLSAEEFDRSKRNIFVTPFKGQFFKRCPGARPGLACCNYFVLNWGLQCNMNCSYCYLQSFINTPALTLYSNLDDALEELKSFAPSMKDQPLRVGTGETVDSLSLDPLTLFSHDLIAFFRDYPKWNLEFKTKSAGVGQFLDCDHAGNVIVSWSINPQTVITAEEHGTASLDERLHAAEMCRARGYKIAFHIDPMIWHPGWRESYGTLAKEITKRFAPSDMPYISVGALRFQPEQRHMMRERFGGGSWITQAEVFKSSDGKLRYHQSVRSEMFQFLNDAFRSQSSQWNLFLCMETPDTWLASTGHLPQKTSGLEALFDSRVVQSHRRAEELQP
jgi:spore photoproduct lyase